MEFLINGERKTAIFCSRLSDMPLSVSILGMFVILRLKNGEQLRIMAPRKFILALRRTRLLLVSEFIDNIVVRETEVKLV